MSASGQAEAPPGNATRLGADIGASKPNVLFIVLDAARAQSFGVYGHTRATTPNIDRLAGEGFTFDNAYTTAAYTLAAMSSVWTSQQPDRHHGDVAFSAKLPKDRLILAEVLNAQGIHTAGFVANQVAGSFNGFDRGFKEFDEPWRKYGSAASGFRNVDPGFPRPHEEGRARASSPTFTTASRTSPTILPRPSTPDSVPTLRFRSPVAMAAPRPSSGSRM